LAAFQLLIDGMQPCVPALRLKVACQRERAEHSCPIAAEAMYVDMGFAAGEVAEAVPPEIIAHITAARSSAAYRGSSAVVP